MKKAILIFILFLCNPALGQLGQWVWLRGNGSNNNPGNFGIQGIANPANDPPSLYEPCEWTDLNGDFWLFGGGGVGGTYGDLWKYSPATNEWTWMKGTGLSGIQAQGVYGTQGIASPLNIPPPCGFGINSWLDMNGDLWMFGGAGILGTNVGDFSDLWKYEIATNQWTWVKGPGTLNHPGIYGIKGVPDTLNNPPSRSETSASWTDNNGDLWMFGGKSGNAKVNDLWRYNISTNTWTWMKGSNLPYQFGHYGIKGVEDSLNTPGARWAYCRWKDDGGNLWLYGGDNKSDLWKFNVGTNQWAWMEGDSSGGPLANDVFVAECLYDVTNKPGHRNENRAAWKDNHNNLWMIGGGGASWNELWMYNINSGQWIMADQDSLNPQGVFGIQGVPDPANIPNGSWGSIGWKDNNGHLYLFGGRYGVSPTFNTLWKYVIDTNCVLSSHHVPLSNDDLHFEIVPNPNNGEFSLELNNPLARAVTSLIIYDIHGKTVWKSNHINQKAKFRVNLSPGCYNVRLINNYSIANRKLLIIDQ